VRGPLAMPWIGIDLGLHPDRWVARTMLETTMPLCVEAREISSRLASEALRRVTSSPGKRTPTNESVPTTLPVASDVESDFSRSSSETAPVRGLQVFVARPEWSIRCPYACAHAVDTGYLHALGASA